MAKAPKVTDKEMIKWIKILGVKRFLQLYIEDDIRLSTDQLETLLDIKNGTKQI